VNADRSPLAGADLASTLAVEATLHRLDLGQTTDRLPVFS
jgi:hypothetical protein